MREMILPMIFTVDFGYVLYLASCVCKKFVNRNQGNQRYMYSRLYPYNKSIDAEILLFYDRYLSKDPTSS